MPRIFNLATSAEIALLENKSLSVDFTACDNFNVAICAHANKMNFISIWKIEDFVKNEKITPSKLIKYPPFATASYPAPFYSQTNLVCDNDRVYGNKNFIILGNVF
jgi:hypothetical protein